MMDQNYALKVWIRSTFDISLNVKNSLQNRTKNVLFSWQRSTFAVIKWFYTFFLEVTQV